MIKCSSKLEAAGLFKTPEKVSDWLEKYVTVNHRSFYGEKGFILQNGTYERFEPIGITWNDSYCRRITDGGSSGCFIERDLSAIADFDHQKNDCIGKDSTFFLRVKGSLQARFFLSVLIRYFKNILNLNKIRTHAMVLNGDSVTIVRLIF